MVNFTSLVRGVLACFHYYTYEAIVTIIWIDKLYTSKDRRDDGTV